jgi:protein TonB
MKILIKIVFLTFFIINQSYGQAADTSLKAIATGNWLELSYRPVNEEGKPVSFLFIEEMPSYPGGWDSLSKFIMRNLDYPKSAVRDSIQGRVLTRFAVDCEGKVSKVETFKGVRYDLDSACMHVVSILPRWIPFKQSTKEKIWIQFILPVKFLMTR